MTLGAFAKQNRLRKPHADECGDLNIIGKRGDIYDYGDGKFFCCTILHAPNAFHWNRVYNTAKACGYKVTQNGDEEGTFLFDPTDPVQAKFAIRSIRALRKKVFSPEARLKLAERCAKDPRFNRKTQTDEKPGL